MRPLSLSNEIPDIGARPDPEWVKEKRVLTLDY
jgi:hypothetical protein